MTQSRYEELLVESRRQALDSTDACNPTVIEDLVFLNSWEEGRHRSLSAIFRARQIRRADPVQRGKVQKGHRLIRIGDVSHLAALDRWQLRFDDAV
jgi:hypothetical protein